jgi:hypothetical protein
MRKATIALFSLASFVALTGCAMQPVGPTVRVMPGPYKPFEVFQRDQYDCGQYADMQVAGAADAANGRALGATAIGAGLGLALGAATGDGHVATAGAIAGGAVGATIGADQSDRAGYSIQQRYDMAYAQCMYAKGNQVPGYGPPTGYGPPPPPPGRGAPPPPPRG